MLRTCFCPVMSIFSRFRLWCLYSRVSESLHSPERILVGLCFTVSTIGLSPTLGLPGPKRVVRSDKDRDTTNIFTVKSQLGDLLRSLKTKIRTPVTFVPHRTKREKRNRRSFESRFKDRSYFLYAVVEYLIGVEAKVKEREKGIEGWD